MRLYHREKIGPIFGNGMRIVKRDLDVSPKLLPAHDIRVFP